MQTSWCDLDFTFDVAAMTLSLKILSKLYLRNYKGLEVDIWKGHWLWCRCVTSCV